MNEPETVVIPQDLKQLFDWYRNEIVMLKKQLEKCKEQRDYAIHGFAELGISKTEVQEAIGIANKVLKELCEQK